jgi:hypothetical protein
MKQSNALLYVILLSALLLGCKNEDLTMPKNPIISETANTSTPVSPVGTSPAGPSKEATATTSGSASSSKSDVSKVDQSASMPLPGQANDHSAIVPKTSEFPKTSP